MAFTREWDPSRILDHSKFKEQPGYTRSVMEDIQERLTNYLYGFSTADDSDSLDVMWGFKKITLVTIGTGSGSIPTGTGSAESINLQGKTFHDDDNGAITDTVELITIDADGNEIRLTKKGYINLAVGKLANNYFLKARNYDDNADIEILKVDTGNGAVMGVYLSLIDDDLSNAFAAIGTGTPFGASPDGSIPADNLALPLGYFVKKVTDGIPVPSITSLPAAGTGNAGTLFLLKGSGTGYDKLYLSKNTGVGTYAMERLEGTKKGLGIDSGTSPLIGGGSTYVDVDFNFTFASAPVIVATPNMNIGGDSGWWVSDKTTTGFRINHYNGVAGTYNWIAIGERA